MDGEGFERERRAQFRFVIRLVSGDDGEGDIKASGKGKDWRAVTHDR